MPPYSSSICAIIPTYNRAPYIREALDSVLLQSRPVQQVIVVNDGSTDETKNILKSYGDRISLISKNNGGKSSAINAGLAQCISDYVWIFDDDDIAARNGIEHLSTALDADNTFDFGYGTYQYFRDNDHKRIFQSPVSWDHKDEPNLNLQFLEGMFTHLGATLVRYSHYQKVGLFREDSLRSQDFEMAIRLSRGSKAVYVPKTIFFYRDHEGVRGPASERFSSKDNIQKWLAYEQKILSRVRRDFSLKEFTPTFAFNWDALFAKRAALLERALVFAKYSMWDEALDDFKEANALSSAPATPEEIKLAERVIKYLPPWEALCKKPEWLAAIRGYQRSGMYGKHIIFAASRALFGQTRYWFRSGNITHGTKALKILFKVLGPGETNRRIVTSLIS